MSRKSTVFLFIVFLLIAFAATAALAQSKRRLPSNQELVSRARSVYVDSDSVYMKRENLESSLLGREEFKAWEIQVTGKREFADLAISVRRVPFTNHFTYTVTDTETDTVVMAGKVDSLAGTVYGLIADEIVHKMKVYRGDPLAGHPAPKS
jgi:hypothetical protein